MAELSNHIRSKLIIRLQESAGYREHLDLSSFLNAGITQAEIGVLDYAQDQLSKCPYLEESDFVEKGITSRQIQKVLGGIDNFKVLLGIRDYCFANWLEGQELSKGLAIPYFIYQKFAAEIRESYMSDCKLVHFLKVELNDSKQFQEIPLLNVGRASIPATDIETLGITSLVLCERYSFIDVDKENCILTLKNRSNQKVISIEVRCLSTHFCKKTDFSVCVIDDLVPTKNLPVIRKIFALQDLIH